MIAEPSPHRQSAAFALRPLAEQPIRDLVVLLFAVSVGLPLRPGLQVPGVSDAQVVRRAIRRREWDTA